MLNFKEFIEKNLNEENTVGKHNDYANTAFLSSDFTGSETPPNFGSRPGFLPSLDTLLPSVTKSSRIRLIERNKNPISIVLEDGTHLFLTWSEYKRIVGAEPQVGRKITVVFQRNEQDRSKSPSKINSITCH